MGREADAPVDNESMIQLLKEEGLENDGYLAVDNSSRGIETS